MRLFFVFLIICKSIFAQYDSTMYNLIKTTYERSFDKRIINSYLNSHSPAKIKAAILSISQSEDTSFVPELLNTDLEKYGNDVCFAIGQIGSCSQSLQFLWKYLKSDNPQRFYPEIFYAIGKIGDINDLNKLVSFYNSFSSNSFPYRGISNAILQFQLRGIINQNVKEILEKEVQQYPNNPERVSDALFVLARFNSSEVITDKLVEILAKKDEINFNIPKINNSNQNEEIKLKEYALMNFQRLKSFNVSENIINEILYGNNDLLKIELAKTIVYWNNKENEQKLFTIIFKLINDKNPNVAIQTAISLKNLDSSLVKNYKEFLKSRILELLNDPLKDNILKSEIFLSGYKLLGNYEDFSKIILQFNPTIECQVAFASFNPDKNDAIKKLLEYYTSNDLKIKIEALNKLIEIFNYKNYRNKLKSTLLDALSSNFPPLISIAADGLDSTFIQNNSTELKTIIEKQIYRFKDNPDFLEATLSLVNLSKKFDNDFYTSVLKIADSSKLYSIRKFVGSTIASKNFDLKELDQFDDIWQFSFRYSGAKIITTKGTITIKFSPEVAPITVGNFCKLASQHFYDGIIFHRVVPGFVIQAGDPTATGWGGPGYDIVSEFSDIEFSTGYVGMASAGKDTEGSQFFIMQGNFPHLDGRYTNFAKVLEGLDIVLGITQNDKIISVQLIE